MDFHDFFPADEKPLEKLLPDAGFLPVFRRLGVIGDSLSAGEFESRASDDEPRKYHDMYEYSWGKYIERASGVDVEVFARGGMSAGEMVERYHETCHLFEEDHLCQGYIVALGVNDISFVTRKEYPFGSVADIDLNDYHNNKKSFVGYYAGIIQRLRSMRPDARFFLMTLPRKEPIDAERNDYENRHRDVLEELTKIFPYTYLLDFRTFAPLYGPEFHKLFFFGHMSPAGYLLTAKMTISYIDYIIRHNMRDFKQVPFIGTDLKNGSSDV